MKPGSSARCADRRAIRPSRSEALVAAVDIARDAVDQHLDAVDVALAVEGAECGLARFGAHAGFGELDAGQLAQQLPALLHVLVLDFVGAEDIY